MAKRARSTGGKAHRFGGDWTTAKLDVLAHYLSSYTTALKDKPTQAHPFRKGYVDAFAGTGYRQARREDGTADSAQALLFPDLAEKDPQALLDGSARLALKTEPRFDRYVFIEGAPSDVHSSKRSRASFPIWPRTSGSGRATPTRRSRTCARRTGARIGR
jgi:three-Cys-motif partner protein